MRASNTSGFTIIETMLFLGITGLLIMGILVGTGVSINIQRYRDSVTSLQAEIQQQFSEVSNVSNNSTSHVCNGVTGNFRGQSDCAILGRLVTTSDDGHSLLVKDVMGVPNSLLSSTTDVDVLKKDYTIFLMPENGETYNIAWNASLVKPGNSTAAKLSILIIRSPLSGAIRTFINPDEIALSDLDIKNLIDNSYLSKSALMCVDSNGLFAGTKMAVLVTAGASSASGVETLGDNSGC